MEAPRRLYGFFSQTALDTRGARTLVYRHADGREVEVNFVTPDPLHSGTSWPDVAWLGEVTKYLRPARRGMLVSKMWGTRVPSDAVAQPPATRSIQYGSPKSPPRT